MLHTDSSGECRQAGAEENRTTWIAGIVARLHVASGFSRNIESAMLVDCEESVICLACHLQERAGMVHNAGVGDHAVDATQLPDGFGHRSGHTRLIRHVDLLGHHPSAETGELSCRLLVLFASPAPDHHVAAGAGDATAETEPDPRIATRYHDDLTGHVPR